MWRSEPYGGHRAVPHGNPQTWVKDSKYKDAAEGFSFGCDNPVPLATVSFNIATRFITSYKFLLFGKEVREERFSYVAFTNGVTRTIWLLAHGCKFFPVECEMPGAIDLHRLAAANGTTILTVRSLLNG